MRITRILACGLALVLCAACDSGGSGSHETDTDTGSDTGSDTGTDSGSDSDTSTHELQSCEGTVVFADQRLEERVRFWLGRDMQLGGPYTGELTGEALAQLRTRLTANIYEEVPDKLKIHSLYGLECAVNLEILGATGNAISDLAPLSRLEKLQKLYLKSNNVGDVSPLLGLASLDSLGLSYNPIENLAVLTAVVEASSAWETLELDGVGLEELAFLRNATSLITLSVFDNQISDLSPLADTAKLTNLFVSRNSLTDLSPLSGLTLVTLYAADNSIEDISGLAGHANLNMADLSGNRVVDISPLAAAAPGMAYLWLHGNAISDISVIADMPYLQVITLYDNAISDISPLEGIPFQGLDLSNNRIADLEPLRDKAAEFGSLNLAHNLVVDFEPVLDVGELNLAWNEVRDLGPLGALVGTGGRFNFAGNPISSLSPFLLAASGGFNPTWLVLSATPLDAVSLDYELPMLCELGVTVFYGDDLSCPGETTDNPYPVSGAEAPSPSTDVLPGDATCESGDEFLASHGVPADVREAADYSVDTTVASEPVVRDSLTGLAWRRCSAGQSWDGAGCTGTATSRSWTQAQEACQGEYGGMSSWRVPTLLELQTLVDRGLAHPTVTIEPTAFPGTYPGRYWSASAVSGSSQRARFAISFYNGATSTATALEPQSEGVKASVRCVLDEGTSAPPERFETSGEVVRDAWTMLEWRLCPSATPWEGETCGEQILALTQSEAADACETLGEGWRLPTANELLSVVDVCRREPALQEPFVDDTRNTSDRGPAWSSTLYPATDTERSYAVDISTGQAVLLKRETLAAARCVRAVSRN